MEVPATEVAEAEALLESLQVGLVVPSNGLLP